MRKLLYPLAAMCLLSSCGSLTLPAAVKMESGEALTGTTTAATSGGTFQVASPTGNLNCSGNYDPFDTAPVISAPVRCSDGRYGTITVLRSPEGRSGVGTVALADGTTGRVAFGSRAAEILQTANAAPAGTMGVQGVPDVSPALSQVSGANSSQMAGLYSAPSFSGASPTYSSGAASSRIYTGNCPTPDSYDAAGRRCGARSAASKPGGYDGYRSWASSKSYSGGSTYVRGYYRKNGTYVRGHSRRR